MNRLLWVAFDLGLWVCLQFGSPFWVWFHRARDVGVPTAFRRQESPSRGGHDRASTGVREVVQKVVQKVIQNGGQKVGRIPA